MHELGDSVTMDVMQLPTNRIEQVRSDALIKPKRSSTVSCVTARQQSRWRTSWLVVGCTSEPGDWEALK